MVYEEIDGTKQGYHTLTPGKLKARKTGILRAKFNLQSVVEMRQSLQSIGSNLLVYYGKP